jgi:hypothetical protein
MTTETQSDANGSTRQRNFSSRCDRQVGGFLYGQRWHVKEKTLAVWRVSGIVAGAGLRIGRESEDWKKSTAAESLSPYEDVG